MENVSGAVKRYREFGHNHSIGKTRKFSLTIHDQTHVGAELYFCPFFVIINKKYLWLNNWKNSYFSFPLHCDILYWIDIKIELFKEKDKPNYALLRYSLRRKE